MLFTMPERLHPGDTVRVVAPSGAFERERFLAGVELITAAGLVPAYDEGIFSKHRYLAGDDARRAAELDAALSDPNVRAIWAARGGYGAMRILPNVRIDRLRARAPWLIGFSDATALHATWQRAGLVSCHGANVTTLLSWSAEARQELFSLLVDGMVSVYQGSTVCAGAAVTGPLLGGNLTVLSAMVGTGALPSFDGAILLLEDIGERPYRIDRRMTQLLQAGLLRGVRGVVLGQFTNCDEPDLAAVTVVADLLAPLGIPVLRDLPLGHDDDSRAVLLGAVAELDPERATLTVRR